MNWSKFISFAPVLATENRSRAFSGGQGIVVLIDVKLQKSVRDDLSLWLVIGRGKVPVGVLDIVIIGCECGAVYPYGRYELEYCAFTGVRTGIRRLEAAQWM